MKIIKALSNLLVEQDGPDLTKFKPVADVTVKTPDNTARPRQTSNHTNADPVKKDTTSTSTTPKPGELSADTKKKAAINSFGTISLSTTYDSTYFAMKMNNLYSANPTVYKKVKNQLISKGYKFGDRFDFKTIDFYYKVVYRSQINRLAPEGQKGTAYWPVIRELFKNYAPTGDTVSFNTIKTLQKPMTVTLIGGTQKSFGSGMEYFLTRLKQANSSSNFSHDEAMCFLAFLCTLAPSALAELTAYAAADQNFSSVSNPETIVLDELDVPAAVTFYKVFVQGVRKKGGTWTIDDAWVISSGFVKTDAVVDKFMKMINDAVTGNYIDEALPKIKSYSAPVDTYVYTAM